MSDPNPPSSAAPTTPDLIVIDPTEPIPPGLKEAVFVAVTAWAPIYKDYEDPTMSPEARAALYPMVILMNRWDGKVGFVGGFRESSHGLLKDTAVAEAEEELNLDISETTGMFPLISHQNSRIRVHLFHHPLDVVSVHRLRGVLAAAACARDCVAEGAPFWAHLADYGRDKGYNTLRHSSTLATAVGEELDVVRATLLANPPPGACK